MSAKEDEQEKQLEQELREGLEAPVDTLEQTAEATTPTPQPKSAPADTPTHASAGLVVLQWLSYAFWGWLIIALIWLVSLTLSSALLGTNNSGAIPYALAAGIVMLPVAFVTDLFYRRHEPIKKHAAAMVIMVLHAVIYALTTIGALITTVFIGLNMAINGSPATSGADVALYTALFTSVAFGITFLRILNPFKTKRFSFGFAIGMLAATVLLIILGLAGPAVQALSVRDDRLIEQNLSDVARGVDAYVQENDELPTSLKDIELSKNAQVLIDRDLVEYTNEGRVAAGTRTNKSSVDLYYYELCVTFKADDRSNYYGPSYNRERSVSPIVYGHDKGKECYKLQSEAPGSEQGVLNDYYGNPAYN